MRKQFLLTCFISIFLFQGSFANTPLDKKTKEDNEPKIERLLIIVLVRNVENRKTLEEELSFDFSDKGVHTVLSYNTRLAGLEHVREEDVLATCKKNNADGVLLVKLIDVEEQNAYSYNQRSQYTGAGTPSYNSSGVVINNTGVYAWGDYAYGNYFDAVSSNIIEIKSDLYHTGEKKIIFTNTSKMRVGEIEEAIGKFSKKLSKQIVKSKKIETYK
ncbi:hypothetical protein N6H18_18330 [Reichenbachiella agarivorans]|uniref:DUF4136 domain-containing protein n=1 Tax=Reichenbachiella agarivorans TaxID=2979464 RepID=A0ABY6CPK5_9BACT|nr:hypothetical protein [Reichenbachiella agarivorans]UXP32299.1 hypothetical protein N6H18_18330 [Reichenbachiella agarivorans]